MFQFAGLPPPGLCIQPGVTGHYPSRVSPFGHLRINVCSRLPGLFAACHVLHRLLAPRHPPRALCSLTTTATHQAVSCRNADHENWPARAQRPRRSLPKRSPEGFSRKRNRRFRSGSGMHLAHNSAKLKIFNLPKHIQLLRFGALRQVALVGSATSRLPFSSDPLVGGSTVAHGSEERCRWTRKRRLDLAEPPFSQRLRSSSVGASGPDIQFRVAVLGGSFRPPVDPGGGDEETRTPDPLLAKEMLCQLSYVPRRQGSGGRHWTRTSDLCLIRAAL